MGLADDRKPVNLMTVHVSKSVTAHEVSNNKVPGKPTSLKASSIGSSKITLTWKKSPNADGYYIYRSTSKNGTYKKIANITKSKGTTYTDKKLKKNKKYYYKLVSYKKTSNKNTVFLSPNSKILPQRTKH